MGECSLWEFLTERTDLGADCIPAVQGHTHSLRPLVLMTQQERGIWEFPYAQTELLILGGLREYVAEEGKEKFEKSVDSAFCKDPVEIRVEKDDLDLSFGDDDNTSAEKGVDVSVGDGFEVIHLDKLQEEYLQVEQLANILSETVLDTEKMSILQNHGKLLLISSVVYGEKFERESKKTQQDSSGQDEALLQIAALLKQHSEEARQSQTAVSNSSVATGKVPVFYKICEVRYDKETKRLQVCREATDDKAPNRDWYTHDDKYRGYRESVVRSQNAPRDFADAGPDTPKKAKIVKNITTLLKSVNTIEERKAIVHKYVDWLGKILQTRPEKLSLETPLTTHDCKLFRDDLFIPTAQSEAELTLKNCSEADYRLVQEYGLVFHQLKGFSNEEWQKLQTKLG